jgi:hypothetical protein
VEWLKWYRACLTSVRPWVQTPVQKKKKMEGGFPELLPQAISCHLPTSMRKRLEPDISTVMLCDYYISHFAL